MTKYRAVVVGLGNIGFSFSKEKREGIWSHAEAYNVSKNVELVAGVDPISAKKKDFLNYFDDTQISFYSSIDDLLNNEDFNIASICTPTHLHFSVFEELLKNKRLKGVIIEKPCGMNLEETIAIDNLAKQKGVSVAVNYIRRWDERYIFAKQFIDENLGRIIGVNAIYPGKIKNIGSHLIDTIFMLTGEDFEEVKGYKILRNAEDPDVSGIIKLKNNIFANIQAIGNDKNLVFELSIIGEKGRLTLKNNGENFVYERYEESNRYQGYRELKVEEISKPNQGSLIKKVVENLINYISDGVSLNSSINEAIQVKRVIKSFLR